MNRLEYIAQTNPSWAIKIREFMDSYPIFAPYEFMVPLSPSSQIPYHNVNSLFEAILHYTCATGVRYSYAVKQWEMIYPLINHSDWETILSNAERLRNNTSIQNKKREIYYNICRFMSENNLNHNTLNTSHLKLLQKNVSGIGIGCVAWCKKYFTCDEDCVEYTDIYFVKGFQTLYQTNSISLRKKMSAEWTQRKFGRIANLMVLGISGV